MNGLKHEGEFSMLALQNYSGITPSEAVVLVISALKNTAPHALQDVPSDGGITPVCRGAVEVFWDRHGNGQVDANMLNILILSLKAAGFGDMLVANGEAGPSLREALNLFLATGGLNKV